MKTDDWELRILDGVGKQLAGLLATSGENHEAVVFGFISPSTPTRSLILREVTAPPCGAFLDGEHGADWSHRYTVQIASEAASRGCGVCILHSHGGIGLPRLSWDDLESFEQLAGGIGHLFPGLPFASVVLSGDGHCSGRVLLRDGGLVGVTRSRWLGWPVELRPVPRPLDRERAKRHDVVWGAVGEGRLHAARVGIIGVGGGGSHVAQQLAHAGVGSIVAVDGDVLDGTNRSRVVGTRPSDIGKKKLRATRRLVRDAGDDCEFISVPERFPGPKANAALATCDVIVACVDTLHVRRDIMEFAWQHAVPLVDIGLTIDPADPSPGVRAIGGQVFIGLPGCRCMWCEGILSKARLDQEKDDDGYVRGGGGAQVVSLNGVMASQAVTEVLNLITGFLGERAARLVYDGTEMFAPTSHRRVPCDLCNRVGFGDVVWQSAAASDRYSQASS